MTARRSLPPAAADSAVGAVTAALLLSGFARPGYPLLRDMVATPDPPLSDAALGVGEVAARAAPQDVVMVVLDRVFSAVGLPTWPILGVLTFVFCVWLAIAAGALVRAALPASTATAAVRLPAVVIALWNPFVVERLLQGHWSLLAGVAAATSLLAVVTRHGPPTRVGGVLVVGGLVAAGGITPTGWLFAVLALVAAWLGHRLVTRGTDGAGRTPTWTLVGVVVVVLAAAGPWLVPSILGLAPADSAEAAVAAFAARAEPGIGTLGSVFALGGIWNVDAVPGSRHTHWALAALALLVALWGVAARGLWRSRANPAVAVTVPLGLLAVIAVAAAASPAGQTVLTAIVDGTPGGGLLRDAQKFVGLAIPATVLAAAFAGARVAGDATAGLFRRGLAVATVIGVAVASVPDAPLELRRQIDPVTYGPGWAEVERIITEETGEQWTDDDPRAVLVLPAGSFRSTELWADGRPVLDPTPRMLDAPVLVSGDLVVGGVTVEGEGGLARHAEQTLVAGGDASSLALLGVGWVLDLRTSTGERGEAAATIEQLDEHFVDDELALYSVPEAVPHHEPAAGAERTSSLVAHGVWAALLLAGLLSAAVGPGRPTRWARPRR